MKIKDFSPWTVAFSGVLCSAAIFSEAFFSPFLLALRAIVRASIAIHIALNSKETVEKLMKCLPCPYMHVIDFLIQLAKPVLQLEGLLRINLFLVPQLQRFSPSPPELQTGFVVARLHQVSVALMKCRGEVFMSHPDPLEFRVNVFLDYLEHGLEKAKLDRGVLELKCSTEQEVRLFRRGFFCNIMEEAQQVEELSAIPTVFTGLSDIVFSSEDGLSSQLDDFRWNAPCIFIWEIEALCKDSSEIQRISGFSLMSWMHSSDLWPSLPQNMVGPDGISLGLAVLDVVLIGNCVSTSISVGSVAWWSDMVSSSEVCAHHGEPPSTTTKDVMIIDPSFGTLKYYPKSSAPMKSLTFLYSARFLERESERVKSPLTRLFKDNLAIVLKLRISGLLHLMTILVWVVAIGQQNTRYQLINESFVQSSLRDQFSEAQ
ncbi:hypothetical protein AKJ16_DCAP22841, partial [Drosera capensis]